MNRYLVYFNSKRRLEPFTDAWTVLDNPSAEELFGSSMMRFRSALIVFVMYSKTEQTLLLAAAREMLQLTKEVKIISADAENPPTEERAIAAPAVPESLLDMDDDEFAELAAPSASVPLHPAQDYHEGVMYYGCMGKEQDRIVSSSGAWWALAAAQKNNFSLLEPELNISRLRHETVIEFFSGAVASKEDELFRNIRDYINRHIYFPDAEPYHLLALWTMGTYIFRAFRYYPYLHLNAEKGSGKTLLMELLAPVAFNGILLAQPAASTAVRLVHQSSASLFIDEAEGLAGSAHGASSQIKQILKTGFARSGLYYIGEKMYRTYGPKCFAGINDLDDVLADRSITLKMIRKTASERKNLYREDGAMRKEQTGLRDRLYLFGLRCGPSIACEYERTDGPIDRLTHLSNRCYDIWLPLYKIASALRDDDLKAEVFDALDRLSQIDVSRRTLRDAEDNETGLLIEGISEVLKTMQPLQTEGKAEYYDPDAVFSLMVKEEIIAKSVTKKAFSRLLRRTLEIPSVPHAYAFGTKRMYLIDRAKFEEYKKRYGEAR